MGKDSNIEQMTDKGWKVMRQTLDREMPEENRSRRGAWWWAAALLLLSFAFLGGWQGWFGAQKSTAPAAVVPIAVSPVVVQPAVNPSASDNPSAAPRASVSNVAANRPTTSKTLVQTPGLVPEPAQNKSAKSVTTDKNIQPAEGSRSAQRLSQGLAPTGVGKTSPRSATALLEEPLPASTLPPAEATPEQKTTGTPSESSPLPDNANETTGISSDFQTLPSVLPLPKTSALTSAALTQPSHQASHWHFGIAANAFTMQFSDFKGFSAGAIASWQPLRRWGVYSGLLYAHQQTPNSTAYSVATISAYDYYTLAIVDGVKTSFVLDNTSTAPIMAGNSVALDSLRTEVLYAPVSSIGRLELPIIPFFQVGPRLRVYGGASLNYLLRANVQSQNIVASRLLQQAAQGNSALIHATDPAALRRLAKAGLPTFDTRLNLGLGWHLSKNIELQANWQHSFRLTRPATARAYAESLKGNIASFDPVRASGVSRTVFPSVFTVGAVYFFL